MDGRKRIIFLGGGAEFHPANGQAGLIASWLGPDYWCRIADGLAAFEHLAECDLLVLIGQHWTGWGGQYRPPGEFHRRAFERYVAAGRPLLASHGAIYSFDDWPAFGRLVGFSWVAGVSSHAPLGEFAVRVLNTGHPIIDGVGDYRIFDELYCDIRIDPGITPKVHARADWEGQAQPMVITGQGGRTAGAGKTAYLAHGHDLRAFECPALRKLWLNAVKWCLEE